MKLQGDRRQIRVPRPRGFPERRHGERRRGKRVAVEILVEVAGRSQRNWRRTANLSQGGLAFHQPVPQGLGSRLELTLHTAPGKNITLVAEVVGVNEQGRGTRVRFLELSPQARAALDSHLKLFDEPTRIVKATSSPPPLSREPRVLEGVLVLENDPLGRELRLRSSEKVIGRDPLQVDFVIDHPSVSRRHAYVELHQGRHVITDLGSTNGITFRGHRVHSLVLKDGMVLRLGEVELQYLVTRTAG